MRVSVKNIWMFVEDAGNRERDMLICELST